MKDIEILLKKFMKLKTHQINEEVQIKILSTLEI